MLPTHNPQPYTPHNNEDSNSTNQIESTTNSHNYDSPTRSKKWIFFQILNSEKPGQPQSFISVKLSYITSLHYLILVIFILDIFVLGYFLSANSDPKSSVPFKFRHIHSKPQRRLNLKLNYVNMTGYYKEMADLSNTIFNTSNAAYENSTTADSDNDFPDDIDDYEETSTKNLDDESIVTEVRDITIKNLIIPPKKPYENYKPHCVNPPPLPPPESINCSAYPRAFNGLKRSKPSKIAHIVQFGFDVDSLEIHLNELYDIIDKFFILESTSAHKDGFSKPLIFERIKDQPRFKKFADKIVHLVMDDGDHVAENNYLFAYEDYQERQRWSKFVKWNQIHKEFSDDDIIGFGDTDQIAARFNVHLIKHCQTDGPVDIGMWFPYCGLDTVYRSDWPIPGHPLTIGDPTFYTFAQAKVVAFDGTRTPTRQRGRSGRYLLGGIHMSDYPYAPFRVLKHLFCTECDGGHYAVELAEKFYLKTQTLAEIDSDIITMANSDRCFDIDTYRDDDSFKQVFVMPWFFACNIEMYSMWTHYVDPRLF